MSGFTPIASTVGGLLIGVSATIMLAFNGRIAGISGIAGGLLHGRDGFAWRIAFLIGLLGGGALTLAVLPQALGSTSRSVPVVVVAGLLVGFGTRLGSGCTSGHGVCGIARGSVRSLTATAIFIATAAVVVALTRGGVGA